MSYFGSTGRRAHAYMDVSQPLYGLGMAAYEQVGAYELAGLGNEPAAPAASEPFFMPAGLQHLFLVAEGQPRAEGQDFLAKFTGKMVPSMSAFDGAICDNVAGAPGSGESVDAAQAIKTWQAAGFFVAASQKAGICDRHPRAFGKATWTAYRVPKERIGELVGSPDFIWGLPWGDAPTAANWAKYASYLGKSPSSVPLWALAAAVGVAYYLWVR